MNTIQLVNVDLEVVSGESLDKICAAFSPSEVYHLYNGKSGSGYFASFEADSLGADAEGLIHIMCDAIESFDDETKELWFRAKSRVFDIGYEYTGGDVFTKQQLKFDTLKRVVDLKSSIVFTYYPVPPGEETTFILEQKD